MASTSIAIVNEHHENVNQLPHSELLLCNECTISITFVNGYYGDMPFTSLHVYTLIDAYCSLH